VLPSSPTSATQPAQSEPEAPFPATARAHLSSGAEALGVPLTDSQLDAFASYATLLASGRRAFSLTTLSDPIDVADKHFLDSLTVLRALPAGPLDLLDVGSGAGLPGIPLKLVRPELRVTLLEATGKKVTWLKQTIAALDLEETYAIAERAETLAHSREHRASYDVVVARAVAALPALLELCLPFVRPGGLFIAQKTTIGLEAELPAASRALSLFGGRFREIMRINHPALPNRALVLFEQPKPVPPAYPRRPGMPVKRPL
jgi:16S rRNA (guanine527-N7)-methyltransferase